MRRQRIVLALGILLIAGGLLGASFTLVSPGTSAHTESVQQDDRSSPAHEQMHQMMDAMMGEGFTEQMHAAMPGSEQMMEFCANAMSGMMNGDNMGNMMNGMEQ